MKTEQKSNPDLRAGKEKRVGILGGTFDPIHTAHLILAEAAYDTFSLEEVLLMPSGHSYLKDDRPQKVLPPQIRYEMVCEAAAENPHFTASDFELRRPGNTYTCDTLRELKALHPDTHYFFIVGADSVRSILTWKNPEEIFQSCTLLAALREDGVPTEEFLRESDRLRRDYGADLHMLEIPAIGISSTDIRNRVKNGRTIHYLVPDRVERYIMEKGIYR
ncbi:MAG: nicotinate-nucleotide adenylyltransferase [Eubacteriales bacterium]|nr:nicotinate-nucleotide adenylyltransferase [Eubacteriales bacterium]